MRKAVIFDMDGTLWDSSCQVTDSWNIIFKKHNLAPITYKDMQNCMGLMMDDIFKKLLESCDEEERKIIQKESEEFENEYLRTHCGVLYDGLEITLKFLKDSGYSLMIVTNAQDGYVQAFLKSSRLSEYFDDFEMFGRTRLSKDENIKLILKRNNIKKAVYVGDTYWDYKSSINAGLEFIHAAYGFGEVPQAQWKINTFSELKDLVPQILGRD